MGNIDGNIDAKKNVGLHNKIILPEETQKSIMKFFLKTSIPRIVKQQREDKETKNKIALSEIKGQEIKK